MITEYELLSGTKSKHLLDDTIKILGILKILDFTSTEARRAAEIYKILKRKNAIISSADIFIAATAINYELPLATLNLKHFNRIQGLKLHPI